MKRTDRPAAENRSGRTRRPFVGDTRDTLAVTGKDPNYEYRIVNDERGRVQRMIEAGYEIEESPDVQLNAGTAPTQPGSAHTLTVFKDGTKGILMKIPKEFAEEDRKARAEQIKSSEEALFKKERETDGRYGEVGYEK